jgi:hypothetical protein
MTLVIEAPVSYEAERRYILDVVLAGWLGIDWELRLEDRSDVRIGLKGAAGSGHVVVPEGLFATELGDWLTPASLPPSPTLWRRVVMRGPGELVFGEHLPVVYGSRTGPIALHARDGPDIRLGVDVFGSTFFFLTRYEELTMSTRDRYGRFLASSSVAHREGFLGLPVVDAYVELLWSALASLWPRLQRKRRDFRLWLTHDVDRPLAFLGQTGPGLVRQLAADAVVRRDPGLFVRRLGSWIAAPFGSYRLDPYNTFDFLMTVSERLGISSAFYFLATKDTTLLNGCYTLEDPWIKQLMTGIHERGHEIGFHAGFDTYRDPNLTVAEYRRLRTAVGDLGVVQEQWGGRQHYLQWENPVTWSNWERAGLDYDSTPGFADQVGFRFGTCHQFRTFHLDERRPMRLDERPLHVMDATLFEYMKLDPDQAFEVVLGMARECRRFKGTMTLLWHNSALPAASQRGWYETLTSAVACRS